MIYWVIREKCSLSHLLNTSKTVGVEVELPDVGLESIIQARSVFTLGLEAVGHCQQVGLLEALSHQPLSKDLVLLDQGVGGGDPQQVLQLSFRSTSGALEQLGEDGVDG